MKNYFLLIVITFFMASCKETNNKEMTAEQKTDLKTPFVWENANLYFLLTDRFNNGSVENDEQYERGHDAATLRGFEGGDIIGITQKIKEGYFDKLGVNAIWFTPVVEQIHGNVDEGTGLSYGYHGYWAKDWTALDENFGTKEDLRELVETAHKHGIRIVLDGVINHRGPVTDKDPVWPNDWVRVGPQCEYSDYDSTVSCTLVANLPDILTDSEDDVNLPPQLIAKWKEEGRYEEEIASLNAFFERTGYPRAPKYYIIKWLTDYITEFGVDGYRADTVKHTEADVWVTFKTECDYAFAQYKKNNPDKVLDDNDFYLVGEVYNYGISGGKFFDYGDKKVNYFDNMFTSQINFEFKWDAQGTYEEIFSKYSSILNNELKDYSVLNYVTSHDDGAPFDVKREKPFNAATKLMLSPGAAQIYYGDESARPLIVEGAEGDANLRSFMNWDEIESNPATQELLGHWQKLGKFRQRHPSIGAGVHKMLNEAPYVFQRTYTNGDYSDAVIIGLDMPEGTKNMNVASIFKAGDILNEAYTNTEVIVNENGWANFETENTVVLLELKK